MQEFLPNRNSPRFVCQTTLSSNQVTSSARTSSARTAYHQINNELVMSAVSLKLHVCANTTFVLWLCLFFSFLF